MKTTPFGKISDKTAKRIMSLWNNGKNIWEISQLTEVSELIVTEVVQGRAK